MLHSVSVSKCLVVVICTPGTVLVVAKQTARFQSLCPLLFVLVQTRESPAPNLVQGSELCGSLSLWLRIYFMH